MHRFTRTVTVAFALAACFGALPAVAADFTDLGTFQGATSGLTLINFNVDTNGDPTVGGAEIGTTYSSLGVVFPTGNQFEYGFNQPNSPPVGWINNTSDQIGHLFDVDVTGAGIRAIGATNVLFSATATLSAYDSAMNLLEEVTGDSDGSTLDFFGVTTSTDIAHVKIHIVGNGWGLDDLWFGAAGAQEVPEPGTLAMLTGFAIAGLAFRRRKSA